MIETFTAGGGDGLDDTAADCVVVFPMVETSTVGGGDELVDAVDDCGVTVVVVKVCVVAVSVVAVCVVIQPRPWSRQHQTFLPEDQFESRCSTCSLQS